MLEQGRQRPCVVARLKCIGENCKRTAEARGKNRILAAEVLVQRRAADTCAHDDVAYGDVLVRRLQDQRKEGLEQRLTGFLHTSVARGSNGPVSLTQSDATSGKR